MTWKEREDPHKEVQIGKHKWNPVHIADDGEKHFVLCIERPEDESRSFEKME